MNSNSKRLNIRLLVVTGLTCVVVAGGVVTAHSWQISKTARSMLVHAMAQEEQESWLKAAEYLDRYLRLEPEDLQARVRLASDFARGAVTPGQKLRAVDLHYRVLSYGTLPEERSLRERLAELLLETGRLSEAEKQAASLVATQPDSPSANRLLALALYRQYENGALAVIDLKALGLLKEVEKANKLNPHDVPLAVALANLYRKHPRVIGLERPDQLAEAKRVRLADECFQRLVQHNPKSAAAYLARFAYRTQYELRGAQDDLQEALRLAPDDAVVLRTAAFAALVDAQQHAASGSALEAHPFYRRAQELLERLISRQPRQVTADIYLGLGDSHWGQGNRKQAFDSWREGLRTFAQPTSVVQFHARMVDANLNLQAFTEAENSLDAIDQILADLGASISRRETLSLQQHQSLRRSTWHLRRDEPAEAVKILRPIVGQHSAADIDPVMQANAWMLLGAAYSSTQEWIDAAQAFERAAALQPAAAPAAEVAAANAWLQAGRNDRAVDRAQSALRSRSGLGRKLQLEARLAMSTALFRKEMARPSASRDWSNLSKSLEELEKLQPSAELVKAPWQIDFLRAEFEFNQPNSKEDHQQGRQQAAEILKLAEKKYAESAEFLGQLCLLFEQFDLPQEADRILARLRDIPGQPLMAALAAARLAVARKQFDVANRELDQVEQHISTSELGILLDERISIALANRDLALARTLLLRQLERTPRSLRVIKMLADIDLERREMKSLEKWEQSLAQLESLGQPLYLYYHACRMLFSTNGERSAQLQKAKEAQERLETLRPQWSETHALRGMLEQEWGHREQAVAAFERACDLGEPRLYVFERLITLLEALHRGNEAEKYVSQLQLQMPRSQQLTELASRQHLRQFHPDYAVAAARLAVDDRPDDASAHAWLGRMLLLGENPGEAEQEFTRALDLAPHDVSSWHGLFSFYVRIGAKDKARSILKDLAEKARLGEADRSFVLGQGYELLGDLEAAVHHYQEAADKSPTSAPIQLRLAGALLGSNPRRAEACLRQAIQLDPQDSTGRRLLATLLASRGTDAAFQEAESLLKDFEADDLVDVDDQRLRALLYSQKGGREGAARAIELLEELVQSPHGVAGDRLFLAQLYEFQAQSTRDPKSRQTQLGLAKKHLLLATASASDADLRYLASLIDFLARVQSEAELGQWLKRYEDRLTSTPQSQADPIAAYLQLLIRLKKTDGCEAWLEKLAKVDEHPVRPLTLRARVLIANGQKREALQLIKSEGKKRADGAADNREKLLVYQGLGDFLFGLAEFSVAESCYRHVLAAEPTRFEFLVAALAKQQKYAEVVQICADAAKAQKSPKAAIVLGNAIFETSWSPEQLQRANPIIDAALERFPENPGLLYTAGLVRIVQNRSDEAIVLFQNLVALEPRNVAALNNLALLLSERPKERPTALGLIDRALEITGAQPSLLDTKGTILVRDGQASQGVALLESAASGPNPDPRYRLHLALAYRDSGDAAKAQQELKHALRENVESLLLTAADRVVLDDLKTVLSNP